MSKLEYVVKAAGIHLPGNIPLWSLDPGIVNMEHRNFEIPGLPFSYLL